MRGHLLRSSVSLALVACGGATPGAQSPAGDTTVVNVAVTPPVAPKGDKTEGPPETAKATVDPHLARQAALQDALEFGMIGLMGAGDEGGVVGGVVGGGGTGIGLGSLGGLIGTGSGLGGLGLSGVGVSAGGSGGMGGIGLGSIGTLGRGGGFRSIGASNSGPSGTSVFVGDGVVLELGDSSTLGLSAEQASTALRNRGPSLRDCYQVGIKAHPQLTGSVGLRIVVGRDGRVQFTRIFDSQLGDATVHACLTKALKEAYVGTPAGGAFGVVETVISFHPAPKK